MFKKVKNLSDYEIMRFLTSGRAIELYVKLREKKSKERAFEEVIKTYPYEWKNKMADIEIDKKMPRGIDYV